MFGRQGLVLIEEPPAHRERDWFAYTTSDAGLTWSNPQVVPAQLPQPLDMPWQLLYKPKQEKGPRKRRRSLRRRVARRMRRDTSGCEETLARGIRGPTRILIESKLGI